ncbi:hypothetical protein JDV02_009828 [Purpureocillium takamizusanense]|uniref:Calcineurin-like phosphoesterase domain-containing protein n=1 Tax=Purpureocillium takamizusanense TaxID=2060973 RepID=A0A9Q8VGM1_9HYPO|nr:uncharacterized protein JDV02_009828 [Purpureocillium takamizusanense]UNI24049.1 hypothetical protein JDV02_009828 [Purpureocillium takamizusanense]
MASATVKTRILIISDTHGAKPHVKPPSRTSDGNNQPGDDGGDNDNEDELTSSPTAKLLHHSPTGFRDPLPEADVAIHCGDLTRRSTVAEFAATFSFLSALRAPLKLVIAGNHDLALDAEHWFAGLDEDEEEDEEQDEDHKEWQARALQECRDDYRAVRDIVSHAEAHGVRYLAGEGTHAFALPNGARLSLYASPYTPAFGGWAFQYPSGEHAFGIPSRASAVDAAVDVVVTHGPPLGVLDGAGVAQLRGLPPEHPATEHAGCDALFRAVHAARPQLHCFGHIHESWGAYLATWRDDDDDNADDGEADGERADAQHLQQQRHQQHQPTVHSAIDSSASQFVLTARELKPQTHADLPAVTPDQVRRLARLSRQRCVHVDTTADGGGLPTRLQKGRQTLFVNASIMDIHYRPSQLPWLVDLDLPRAEARQDDAGPST